MNDLTRASGASQQDTVGIGGGIGGGNAQGAAKPETGATSGLGRKSWYARFAGSISAIGAVISVIGSAISFNSARQQELQAQHAEVRGIVEKLGRLPREHIELQQKFMGNGAAIAQVSGLINYEMKVLAQRASYLIEKIPGLVAPAERLYIGNALLYANLWTQAEREFAAVKASASELEDVVTAQRFIAQMLFAKGHVERGRAELAESKAAIGKRVAQGFDPVLAGRLDVTTEARWASLEAAQKNCAEYEAHLRQAWQQMQGMPEWARLQIASEITLARAAGCPPQGTPAAGPSPDQRPPGAIESK